MSAPEPNPLVTRSLPGAPWERAPEWLKYWDKEIQDWLSSHLSMGESPWRELRWLTDSREGIGLWIALIALALAVGMRSRERRAVLSGLKWRLLMLAPLVLISDAVSVEFKQYFGRLKPHVNFYNPAYLPALSLPSSHAFNLAFICGLIVVGLEGFERETFAWLVRLIYLLTFVIGVTRVLFGQHYLFDVVVGWGLGFGFGVLAAYGLTQAARLVKTRRRGPKAENP